MFSQVLSAEEAAADFQERIGFYQQDAWQMDLGGLKVCGPQNRIWTPQNGFVRFHVTSLEKPENGCPKKEKTLTWLWRLLPRLPVGCALLSYMFIGCPLKVNQQTITPILSSPWPLGGFLRQAIPQIRVLRSYTRGPISGFVGIHFLVG